MSRRSATRLWIEPTGGEERPAELPSGGRLVIGSSVERADLVVAGQGVASVHCAVGRTKAGGWAIQDLGSEYGTLVNGVRVEKARLEAGDQILIGSRRLKVVAPEEERRNAAPAGAVPAGEGPARAEPAPKVAEPAVREASEEETGRRGQPEIAGYRIVRPLGRGAMGAVFLAVQESLDREVALKVLPPRLAHDEDFVHRFQAEARAAAALNHHNVVTVHDVGRAATHHYLSMEYMDRGSLEERVARDGPLSWRQVLDVLFDAASGLVYAESRGIVHRDIKPANLMQNHSGTTKIADLGLATQAEAEGAETGEGERKLFGTPHFIAPELVRGEKADCRSDLYSLGATAYRLLSGHTPFEGSSTREILRAKLREDPRPLREFVGELPPEIERLVARLMRRDPELRYPSAAGLVRDVEALRSGARQAAAAPAAAGAKGAGLLLRVGVPLVLLAVGAAVVSGLLGGEGDPAGGSGGADPQPVAGPGDGGVTPQPGPDGEPTPAVGDGDAGPRDGDAAERAFELEAENAFLRLGQIDMERADRRDQLRALAEQFPGTSVASRAVEEADQIDAELRASARQRSEREARFEGLVAALREAAQLDRRPVRAGDALQRIAAVEGLEALADDPEFQARRAALEDEVVAAALAELEADLERAASLESEGDFTQLRELLVDVNGRTELPELTERRPPVGVERMLAIRRDVQQRLREFDQRVAAFEARARGADAVAIAESFGGPTGLERELRELDFAAASARIEGLEARLASPEALEWVAGLRGVVDTAAGAVPILSSDFLRWRRKALSDPRERRGGASEAGGADASGVLIDKSGTAERIPWSAFGGNTRALDNLFHERLERDYTAGELLAIDALMRLSLVVEIVGEVAEMLSLEGQSVFTDGEARRLSALFDNVRRWAERAGTVAQLEREEAAARVLADALRAASEGAWAAAVAGIESLFQEHGASLLVRLLSEGTGAGLLAPTAESPGDGHEAGAPPGEGQVQPPEAPGGDDGGEREDEE